MNNFLLGFIAAISKADLKSSLSILWKGMLAIVIVLSAVCIATKIMTLVSDRMSAKQKTKENPPKQNKAD